MGTTANAVHTPHLLRRLAAARARSDELFSVIRPEAFYNRPIPERHRIIFYVGHLEAFDWNLLGRRHFAQPAFDPTFDQLFAFGIDPVGGGLPTDSPQDWPARAQVAAYNQRLRDALDERLAASFDPYTERPLETMRLLHVAIEHRLMHAETLAYILHQLSRDRKFPRQDSPAPPAPTNACCANTQKRWSVPCFPRRLWSPSSAVATGKKRAGFSRRSLATSGPLTILCDSAMDGSLAIVRGKRS